jgi:putative ABC transport system substrate-binding protein
MRRALAFAFLFVAAIAPVAAEPYRVGILTPSVSRWEADAFRQAMRAMGYAEGENLIIDVRSADADLHRLPALAADLVRVKPDVIVAINTPGSRAAIDTGTTIPIVMAVVGDPVALGFVDNLARPGRNVTGIANVATDLTAKRLALFKEAVPTLARVAALYHPDEPIAQIQMRELESAAPALGVELQFLAVRSQHDLQRVLVEASSWRADGLFRLAGQASTLAEETSALATRHRLPLMGLQGADVRRGALMSYFAEHPELFRRVAAYVDRIIKGTDPGTLPIEQPTKIRALCQSPDRARPRPQHPPDDPAARRRGA